MRVHSQDRPALIRDFQDLRHARLHVGSLHDQGTATATPNMLTHPIPTGKKKIPDQPSLHRRTKEGRRKVPDPHDLGTGPPQIEALSSSPLYVPQLHPVD